MCPEPVRKNHTFFTRPAVQLSILAVISAAIFFFNLGGWDLWNPDEPRYALVAKEMAEGGNWILPHLNNEIYPDKPPVFFWLIALSYKIVGTVTSFSARLPSALAGVLGVILTFLLGAKLYGNRSGFISALVLTTTVEYFWLGRRANIDMTLTLFIVSALFFFYRGYQTKTSKTWSYSVYLFYFSMGIATLTKGPVGFLLPGLTVILYLLFKKDLNTLKKVLFHPGVFLFLAVTLAWVIAACIQGGESYRNEIFFTQTIGRVHNSWSHKQPFYYYFTKIPFLFYPWVFFLPSSFVYLITRRKEIKEDCLFPTVWFITIFVFFTLCSGKRELYLLPLFPAGALMVGFLFNKFFEGDTLFNGRLITGPFYLLLGLFMITCIVVPFVVDAFKEEYRQAFHFFPLIIILGSVSALAFFFLWKKRVVISFTLLLMIMTGSFLYGAGSIFPSMNQFKSAKPFSLRIKSQLKEGDLLVSYQLHSYANVFIFYTGLREIKSLQAPLELIIYLTEPKKRVFCLMQRKDFEALSSFIPIPLFEWDADTIGRRKIVLVSNYARGGEEPL